MVLVWELILVILGLVGFVPIGKFLEIGIFVRQFRLIEYFAAVKAVYKWRLQLLQFQPEDSLLFIDKYPFLLRIRPCRSYRDNCPDGNQARPMVCASPTKPV